MGLMDDAIKSDAEFTADLDQGSEAVTYAIKGGASSTVRAIINRISTESDIAVSGVATREFEVWIPYSSDYGLTANPKPGDKITCKDDPADDANVTKSFDRILEADAGGWLARFI